MRPGASRFPGNAFFFFLVLNVSFPSNSYTSSYKGISEIKDLHFVCVCVCVRGLKVPKLYFCEKSTVSKPKPHKK